MPALIDALWEEWRPVLVAWESNGPQEAELHLIRPQLRSPVQLYPIPSLSSKELRMAPIAGHVRQGRILLPGVFSESGEEIEPLGPANIILQAWRTFPAGDTDVLDALEKAVHLALRGPPPAFGALHEKDLARKKCRRGPARITNPYITPKTYPRAFHSHANSGPLSPDD